MNKKTKNELSDTDKRKLKDYLLSDKSDTFTVEQLTRVNFANNCTTICDLISKLLLQNSWLMEVKNMIHFERIMKASDTIRDIGKKAAEIKYVAEQVLKEEKYEDGNEK
jgi:hypothetical protein